MYIKVFVTIYHLMGNLSSHNNYGKTQPLGAKAQLCATEKISQYYNMIAT